jgi:hypothetical protein
MYPDQTTEYHETAEDARTGWDSETDCYYFIPQADGSGVRMVYGAPGVAVPGEDSMIFYHKRYPAAVAEAAAPHTMLGKGGDALRMADNATKPDAGVFIYKHFNTLTQKWVYYATYYHGLGAIARAQSFGIVNHQYTITQYLGNGAAGAFDPANAGYPMPPRPAHVTFYSPDLVHAKKNYTMAYMNYHIAWVAVPWYLRNLAWLGNNTVEGGHRADGWLGNIPGDLTVVQ